MKTEVSDKDLFEISHELSNCRGKMTFTELKKHIKKTFPDVPVIVNKNYGFEVEPDDDQV